MPGKDLRYNLDIVAKKAQQELGKTEDAAKDVADQLDDTRTAGQKLADAMTAIATDIEVALIADKEAAQALANALGPELAAKTDTSAVVAELKQAGLTLDDIKQDADALADAIRKVDQVKVDLDSSGAMRGQVRGIGDEFDHVSNRADNTRSVVANFAGNATQELPGVTGAMGPLNMALGQFAEYASEGNISLKNFAMAGAGLAVGAFVMGQMADRSERIAKSQAWRTDQIDGFVEAIKEGADATSALIDRLTEAGEVKFDLAKILGMDVMGQLDITPVLAENGVSIQQFADAATEGGAGVERLRAALEATGATAEDANLIIASATQYAELQGEAAKKAADFTTVFGDATAKAAADVQHMGEAARNGTEPARKYNEQIRHMGEAARDGQEPARKLGEVTVGVASAMERAEEATRDYDAAISGLLGKLDNEEALINLGNQFDELKVAEDEAAAAVAKHGAESDIAVEAAERLRLKQIDVTRDMLTYASEVLKLPEHKLTEYQALIDQGSADVVAAELNRIAASRKVWMQLILDVNAAKAAKNAASKGELVGGATGGIVTRPTFALIGEAGPEAVVPLNRTPGSSPLPDALGGMTVNNYNITAPVSMDERQFAEMLRRIQRRGF